MQNLRMEEEMRREEAREEDRMRQSKTRELTDACLTLKNHMATTNTRKLSGAKWLHGVNRQLPTRVFVGLDTHPKRTVSRISPDGLALNLEERVCCDSEPLWS